MNSAYDRVLHSLRCEPKRWLITGAAGFIGSHITEVLLANGQFVRGLDNFSTGHQRNLDDVTRSVGEAAAANFEFIEGSVAEPTMCSQACANIDIVLHQAAIGSVTRSIEDAPHSHASNSTGFLQILDSARKAGIRRFIFASSSSVYGDSQEMPKREERIGNPLSPYAVTKRENELYAHVYGSLFEMETVGLRYFNVFGPRQDPNGPYAAVIPKWVLAMLAGEDVMINGTGETSRDFCYVENAVQANILAATAESHEAINRTYNVATGGRTTLLDLESHLRTSVELITKSPVRSRVVHGEFRKGDVMHSEADISAANSLLGYSPTHSVLDGIRLTSSWFADRVQTVSDSGR